MGTNYYIHENKCEQCGRCDEPIHIGKSSMGWRFLFKAYPEDHWDCERVGGPIMSAGDWGKRLAQDGVQIVDEYGQEEAQETFWNFVEGKQAQNPPASECDFPDWQRYEFMDANGYRMGKGDFS